MANSQYGFNTSKVRIILTASEDANTMLWRFGSATLPANDGSFIGLANYLAAITGGTRQGGAILVTTGAVAASGTITFSSIANNDTITVNGVTFTCKTSGATGNQFNVGASDTAAAVNAAAAINASASANTGNTVTATSAGAVITLTSNIPGEIGNMLTLAISAHGSVSAANFTGGSENTSRYTTKGI